MTHRRQLDLLRAIKSGKRSLGAALGDDLAYANLLAQLGEWEELESLGHLKIKTLRESMTHESRVYTATAILTPEGLEFLEEHADEFGG
jgi:hypothetical protein